MGWADRTFGNRTRRQLILVISLGALILLLLCVLITIVILTLTNGNNEVDSTEVIEEQVLYRLVTQPFKVRAVKVNGAGRDELPQPGDPPLQGFRAEVLSVDFEKTFDMLNKVIYAYAIEPKAPDCTGWNNCTGTREVLIPGPQSGVPFPALQSEQGQPNSLEGLVRNLDPSFKMILDVDATMVERDEILQEVTYRWVSDPKKIVVRFQPNVTVDVGNIVKDQDQDGQLDEDPADGIDNDGDGAIDEDPPLAPGLEIEILDTDVVLGEDVEREQIAPLCRNALACAVLAVLALLIVVAILVILFLLLMLPRHNGENGNEPEHRVRVQSGVLEVTEDNKKDGTVVINFGQGHPQGDATLDPFSKLETGAGGPYREPPCVMVSVAQISDVVSPHATYNLKIYTPSVNSVQIRWTAIDMKIHKIGYIVVGETE